MDNKAVTVACMCAGALSLLYAAFSSSGIAAAISSFFFFASLVAWKYGYIVVPVLCQLLGVKAKVGNIELSPSQDAAIEQDGGEFVASAYLRLEISQSLADKGQEEAASYSQAFERALCSIKNTCQFSLLVTNLDLHDELEEVKARRSMAETKLSSMLSSKGAKEGADAALLRREIAMWNRLIAKLSGGSRPMRVLFYAVASARGASRQEALSRLSAQVLEISAVLSSSLKVDVHRLRGEQIVQCMSLAHRIPTTKNEMEGMFF
ncbi:Uncharacterised protein [Candidatus Anstonella stagnisolia]|nr:Uncharacterised protein [Candidatus Anstonella stagnisolia]